MTTVAMVDDHQLLRQSLANLINSFPEYTVIAEAANGLEFIHSIESEKLSPDIVLLDITMPLMNGYDTAIWIKNNLPESKILVLSMMDHDSAVIRMLRNGAVGYIMKESNSVFFKEALDSIKNTGYYLNEVVNGRMLHLHLSTMNTVENDHLPYLGKSTLSKKESIFLELACSDKPYKEIAGDMGVSARTVDSYRDSLFAKFEIKSRVGLVIFAIKNGLVSI